VDDTDSGLTAEVVSHSCSLVGQSELFRLRSLLRTEDRLRADRFRHPEDADRFVLGRVGLACLVSRRTAVPFRDVVIEPDDHGRPTLPGTGMSCSISHCGDAVVVAIANRPIGVDVQDLPDSMPRGWVELLTNEELAATQPDEDLSFLRGWTRLEAVTKMMGLGLAAPKSSRHLERADGTVSWYRLADGGCAQCTALELTRTRALTVCVRGDADWTRYDGASNPPVPGLDRWIGTAPRAT